VVELLQTDILFNPDNSGVKEIIEELELSIAKKWMPR
jgi:hypothetical protein